MGLRGGKRCAGLHKARRKAWSLYHEWERKHKKKRSRGRKRKG